MPRTRGTSFSYLHAVCIHELIRWPMFRLFFFQQKIHVSPETLVEYLENHYEREKWDEMCRSVDCLVKKNDRVGEFGGFNYAGGIGSD